MRSSNTAKARVYATLVDRRVAEVERLIERDKAELARRTVQRMKNYLEKMSHLSLAAQDGTAEVTPDVSIVAPEITAEEVVKPEVSVQDAAATVGAEERARLQVLWGRYIVSHPDEIRAMLEEAPPSVRPALTRAIVSSINSYVSSYQEAIQELSRSSSGQQSDTSDRQPDTSGQQPGASKQQAGGNSGLQKNASE